VSVWEKVEGEETWTHGNWVVSDCYDHDHWHLYWVDETTYLNDWPLSLEQAQVLASRLDNVLAWSLRNQSRVTTPE
jgi:hypothetical protein